MNKKILIAIACAAFITVPIFTLQSAQQKKAAVQPSPPHAPSTPPPMEYMPEARNEPKPWMFEFYKMQQPMYQIPVIGQKAPGFTAETTEGTINFPKDYEGRWVILFSHPADFTPVCTTEFMAFALIADELKSLNTELVGLSIDSIYSHIAWLRTIKEKIEYKGIKNIEIKFPLIADLKMDISKKYGMIQPSASDTKAVRAVFYVDPKGIIRAILYYPLSNGRNFDEIKRLLIAMQTSDKENVATPADWRPGDDVIIPAPEKSGEATQRLEGATSGGYRCQDWFLCLKSLPMQGGINATMTTPKTEEKTLTQEKPKESVNTPPEQTPPAKENPPAVVKPGTPVVVPPPMGPAENPPAQ